MHPKVLEILTIGGDEKMKEVNCKHIDKVGSKIIFQIGKKHNTDSTYNRELVCGKCGSQGKVIKVTKDVIEFNELIKNLPEAPK